MFFPASTKLVCECSFITGKIAKAVVLTLKQIAASGRTVVCTIHQPRADIWHVFDNVVLLVTGGCAAYSGRADKVVEYFEDAGHVAPLFTNIPGMVFCGGNVDGVVCGVAIFLQFEYPLTEHVFRCC